MDEHEIKKAVKEGYAKAVTQSDDACGCSAEPSCCGSGSPDQKQVKSLLVGYTPEELESLPQDAVLGLGCGNPVAIAGLEKGMTVLDLGSGAGIDCFLAAHRVGPSGMVIGVDMTQEMLEQARANAKEGGYGNVEFRLGEIEHLPVADGTVDVVISNCVINLSPKKELVFAETFRVLKPGGRLMVSDIVLDGELPEEVKSSVYEYVHCVAGACQRDEYLGMISDAGFVDVEVVEENSYSSYPMVHSAKVSARRPEGD